MEYNLDYFQSLPEYDGTIIEDIQKIFMVTKLTEDLTITKINNNTNFTIITTNEIVYL